NNSSCKSERVVKKSPAYVNFVGSELENDTDARFQQIQGLTLALHSHKRIRGQGDIERCTRDRVTTDIESYSARSSGQNLDAAAIVDGKLCTNVPECGKA